LSEPAEIVVSQSIPLMLRIVFGGVASVLLVVAILELSPGIWPISIVTPFFGLILAGALSVLGSLLGTAIMGPSDIWRIRRGEVQIEQRLLFVHQVFILEPEPSACRIVRQEMSDSAPSWHIVINTPSPAYLSRGGFLDQVSGHCLAFMRSRRIPGLCSPGFGSEPAAQLALATLTADRAPSPA
jgi:hypothetical protein